MVRCTAKLLQFNEQGEKTGWTYIEIPADIAQKIKPGNKKSFRVKGKLDHYPIKKVALLPMGGGKFIMALNAGMRKAIGKKKGAMLKVQIEEDHAAILINRELMLCLADEPEAKRGGGPFNGYCATCTALRHRSGRNPDRRMPPSAV